MQKRKRRVARTCDRTDVKTQGRYFSVIAPDARPEYWCPLERPQPISDDALRAGRSLGYNGGD